MYRDCTAAGAGTVAAAANWHEGANWNEGAWVATSRSRTPEAVVPVAGEV